MSILTLFTDEEKTPNQLGQFLDSLHLNLIILKTITHFGFGIPNVQQFISKQERGCRLCPLSFRRLRAGHKHLRRTPWIENWNLREYFISGNGLCVLSVVAQSSHDK